MYEGNGICNSGGSGGFRAIWYVGKGGPGRTAVDGVVQDVWKILQPSGRRDSFCFCG